jgi:hypothetical protein
VIHFILTPSSTGLVDKAIAAAVVICVVLMLASFGFAQKYWFQSALAGSAFTYARETHEPMEARSVEERALRASRTAHDLSARFSQYGSWLGELAILGTLVAGLRSYREWRRWRWLTFAAAGPCLAAAAFAMGRLLLGTGHASTWIPVSCAVIVACVVDLRRPHSTGAGRIVAWSVLIMAVVAALVFAASPPVEGLARVEGSGPVPHSPLRT